MKKNAFTLAEVLITLVIIGVIAAMTIPTLMGNTNNEEYRTKFKKMISTISQVAALEYALYGNTLASWGDEESCYRQMRALENHLSVIDGSGTLVLTLADGTMIRRIVNTHGYQFDLDGKKNGVCWEENNRNTSEYNCVGINYWPAYTYDNNPKPIMMLPCDGGPYTDILPPDGVCE